MRRHVFPRTSSFVVAILIFLTFLLVAGCGGGGNPASNRVFYISGIPDQDVAVLEALFANVAEYLSEETGLDVRYLPTVDYAAVVTFFRHGDMHMAWYGGLTGVQARIAVPDAQAIVQRPRDEEFHSVFVADPALGLQTLEDLRGKTFTFGSESSTSSHLMPRYFMLEADVDPTTDLSGPPSYSGSHDRTWQLVQAGSFQAGVLNEAVWEQRVAAGQVDTSKVDVFYRTPPYYDYHWVIRGDVDEVFGAETMERMKEALLKISDDGSELERSIAQGFQTDRFIETNNGNYQAIEAVATQLGILDP